jgi:hypothetical protein
MNVFETIKRAVKKENSGESDLRGCKKDPAPEGSLRIAVVPGEDGKMVTRIVRKNSGIFYKVPSIRR